MFGVLVPLIAACMSVPVVAVSVSAQAYRIRLNPPATVGEKYLLSSTSSVSTRTDVAVEGQFLRTSKDGSSTRIVARVKTLAVQNNWPTRQSFVVVDSMFTKGAASNPLLPDGTEVFTSLENGKTAYRVSGKLLEEEIMNALSSVIGLHTSEVDDDDMFGTRQRKKVGESWAVETEATARVLREIGIQNGNSKIQGRSTLEKVERNRAFVRGVITVDNVLLPIAPGVTTESGEIKLEFAGEFSVLEKNLNRAVNQTIQMSRSGISEAGDDGKRARVTMIYESTSSFAVRPLK